jgi:dTDP-4-dehydrorhamnose 3,5-epimerase
MERVKLAIEGPVLLTPAKYADERGFVSETYSARRLEPHVGAIRFVQDNHTLSVAAGTLRGLHFQVPPAEQGKLVRVIRGAVYDVAVDIRSGSPTFGRHVAVELSAANWRQLWVPPGFAHGFCTLEPQTEIEYKLTDYYNPEHDRGIAWDDPALAIPWPALAGGPRLSTKDRAQPLLADLPSYFQWSQAG